MKLFTWWIRAFMCISITCVYVYIIYIIILYYSYYHYVSSCFCKMSGLISNAFISASDHLLPVRTAEGSLRAWCSVKCRAIVSGEVECKVYAYVLKLLAFDKLLLVFCFLFTSHIKTSNTHSVIHSNLFLMNLLSSLFRVQSQGWTVWWKFTKAVRRFFQSADHSHLVHTFLYNTHFGRS